jgi:hypothetical protein
VECSLELAQVGQQRRNLRRVVLVDPMQVEIPAELCSPSWDVQPGRTYPRQKLTFEVPFTGDYNLFNFAPSHRTFSTPRARIETHRLLFEFIVLDISANQIREEFQRDLKQIQETLKAMRADVEQFEKPLLGHIATEVKARKQQLLEQDQIVASLGVPVKLAENVPRTLVIPDIQQRKLVVPKPTPSSEPFSPEYKLDDEVCDEILRICHDLGVYMERHPSLYEGKEEEALRDLFLLMLSPHFHSTSGEVFNKKGKTDILIRHERPMFSSRSANFGAGKRASIKPLISC